MVGSDIDNEKVSSMQELREENVVRSNFEFMFNQEDDEAISLRKNKKFADLNEDQFVFNSLLRDRKNRKSMSNTASNMKSFNAPPQSGEDNQFEI